MDADQFLRALTLERRPDEVLWVTQFECPPELASGKHWTGGPLNGTLPRGQINGYVSVGAFRQGGRRRKADQTRALAIVLDDISTDDLTNLPLEPTWVLESSPHNHQVAYVLTDGDKLEEVDRALHMLSARGFKLGPDKSGNNAVRYVRVPGCINNKQRVIEEYGEPYVTRLEALHPERRFTLAQLSAAFATAAGGNVGGEDRTEARETDATLIADILSGRSFHDSFLRLAARWIGKGQSPEAVEAELAGVADRAAETAPPDRLERLRQERQQIPRYIREAISKYSEDTPKISGAAQAAEWPEPQPLAAKVEPEPYPIDALPKTIQKAVQEVQTFTKAPIPLVASSALATVSITCQAHIDVKRAEKLSGPVGLFLKTIADSGERKTTCDRFFSSAIRQYEEKQAESMEPEVKQYHADKAAWEAERDGLLLAIKEATKKGTSIVELRKKLGGLQNQKPEPPRMPRLIYGDVTRGTSAMPGAAMAIGWGDIERGRGCFGGPWHGERHHHAQPVLVQPAMGWVVPARRPQDFGILQGAGGAADPGPASPRGGPTELH